MDAIEIRPEIVTTAPMHVGADVLVEVGPRIRGSVGAGVMPRPYVAGINWAIALFVPEWDEDEKTLVANTLSSSLVVPVRAGWRPFPKLGATVEGGYTLVTLGGESTAAELLEGLAGAELPDDPRLGGEALEFSATATLHLVGIELGWDQKLWRGLHLRGGLGWSFTVASTTDIEPEFETGPLVEVVTDELELYGETFLDDTFEGYAHPPTLTIATGWSF